MRRWRRTLQCASWVSPALLPAAAPEAQHQPVQDPGSLQLLRSSQCAAADCFGQCCCSRLSCIMSLLGNPGGRSYALRPHSLPHLCCCVPSWQSSTREPKSCLTTGLIHCTILPSPLHRGSRGPAPTDTLYCLNPSHEAEESRLMLILALPFQHAPLPHLSLQTCQSHTGHTPAAGEDVGHYGGSYKVTYDLYKKYGEMRLLDTPICGELHLQCCWPCPGARALGGGRAAMT